MEAKVWDTKGQDWPDFGLQVPAEPAQVVLESACWWHLPGAPGISQSCEGAQRELREREERLDTNPLLRQEKISQSRGMLLVPSKLAILSKWPCPVGKVSGILDYIQTAKINKQSQINKQKYRRNLISTGGLHTADGARREWSHDLARSLPSCAVCHQLGQVRTGSGSGGDTPDHSLSTQTGKDSGSRRRKYTLK